MDEARGEAAAERRRYVRLDHIFPVALRILGKDGSSSAWHQAFSQDIGDGGACLTVAHLSDGEARLLADNSTLLDLRIHLPTLKDPIAAKARPAWCRRSTEGPFVRYAVGISYEAIEDGDRLRVRRYVGTHRFLRRATLLFSVALGAGLVAAGFQMARMRWDRDALVRALSSGLARQGGLLASDRAFLVRMEEMKFLLAQSERKTGALEHRLNQAKDEQSHAVRGFEEVLDFFKKRHEKWEAEMSGLVSGRDAVKAKAQEGARQISLLEAKIVGKMRDWLLFHQNNGTGLVASFEGDEDVRDWAFTYDQALAAIVFLKSGRVREAERILDFYLTRAANIDGGGFANAYDASAGDVVEFIAHAGPNIWVGLAALHHADRTKQTRYLPLAQRIAVWLDAMRDAEGGLRGGLALPWYSTEHNLDAYSFYSMLHRATGDSRYKEKAGETLRWLNKNAYSNMGSGVVKRGKGDATIATDTYAWSISSIGPATLRGLGMDPDGIMDFALTNCSVSVDYRRPEGHLVNVKGFDFAKRRHSSRGGVISCEWTGQMILALKIMADYHAGNGDGDKSARYRLLSDEYILEMSKMMIASLSPVGQGEFCLPYASAEFADTGHGWRTPKGSRTGSVAATAYAILAMDEFNPLAPEGALNIPKKEE